MKEQRGAKIMVLVKPVLLIPGKHSFLFSFSFFLYQESIRTLFGRWRDISLRLVQILVQILLYGHFLALCPLRAV